MSERSGNEFRSSAVVVSGSELPAVLLAELTAAGHAMPALLSVQELIGDTVTACNTSCFEMRWLEYRSLEDWTAGGWRTVPSKTGNAISDTAAPRRGEKGGENSKLW